MWGCSRILALFEVPNWSRAAIALIESLVCCRRRSAMRAWGDRLCVEFATRQDSNLARQFLADNPLCPGLGALPPQLSGVMLAKLSLDPRPTPVNAPTFLT